MSFRRILTIFLKEMRDTLRDRRTLIMMVGLPLLLVPGLLVGVTAITSSQQQRAQEKVLQIGYASEGDADELRRMIDGRPDIRIVPGVPVDSAHAFVRSDSLDAFVVVADSFDEQLARLEPGRLTLYHKTDGDGVVARRLREIVDSYRQQLLDERLAAHQLPSSFLQTIDLQQIDVATQQEVIGRAVGGFLPYIFLIFCYLGAMYPAIDLAAGEKERATLETLLTSPASRLEILLGKFGVVVLAGLASAMITLVGLVIGVQQAPDMPQELLDVVQSILSLKVVLLELSLLLPLTMFFASVLLTLSVFARSFKEAQSILSPMSFMVIVPSAIGMLPGINLSPITALIPILNVSLATKEIAAGTIDVGLLALVYASLIVLAFGGLLVCARQFQREEVLFRS